MDIRPYKYYSLEERRTYWRSYLSSLIGAIKILDDEDDVQVATLKAKWIKATWTDPKQIQEFIKDFNTESLINRTRSQEQTGLYYEIRRVIAVLDVLQ